MEDMVKSKKNDLTAIDSRCYGCYGQINAVMPKCIICKKCKMYNDKLYEENLANRKTSNLIACTQY